MGNTPLLKPSARSRFFFPAAATTASLLILLATSTTCVSFKTSQLHPPHFSSQVHKVSSKLGSSSISTRSTALQAASRNNSNNPFTSLISGFASSITGKSSGPSNMNSNLDSSIEALTSDYSWSTIQETLKSQQTPEEQSFRNNLQYGYGQGSPLHKLRLFSDKNKESDVRVTFYRDSASWCPYCQKVWMTLEEKQIPYRVEKINMRCYGDKPPSFLRMQPSGNIPVAEIDGEIYNQSNDIMYVLEQKFPEHKSLLAKKGDDEESRRFQMLLRLERQIFSGWMYWLTGSPRSKDSFLQVLKEVEQQLQLSNQNNPTGKGFFLGDRITMVDLMFAPFLERMAASIIFFKGFQIRTSPTQTTDYPYLNKWFDAMETLDSYQVTKSDYYTHCWDLPPQLGGCTYEPDGEPYENAINGSRNLNGVGGSWEFPLQPDNGGIEPDWTWCNDSAIATREAVERVSANAANIVKFASRGAGKKGMPPVMAALADPNAIGNDAVNASVDSILRIICMTMLDENKRSDMETVVRNMGTLMVTEAGNDMKTGVVDSLAYLRDRVGVPRDMRLPAARMLRANLNWAIGNILDA